MRRIRLLYVCMVWIGLLYVCMRWIQLIYVCRSYPHLLYDRDGKTADRQASWFDRTTI